MSERLNLGKNPNAADLAMKEIIVHIVRDLKWNPIHSPSELYFIPNNKLCVDRKWTRGAPLKVTKETSTRVDLLLLIMTLSQILKVVHI